MASQQHEPKPNLLTIPQELRDHIYSYLPRFSDRQIDLRRKHTTDAKGREALRLYTALTKACRKLHLDITPIFWRNNAFVHNAISPFPPLSDCVFSHIRSLDLVTTYDRMPTTYRTMPTGHYRIVAKWRKGGQKCLKMEKRGGKIESALQEEFALRAALTLANMRDCLSGKEVLDAESLRGVVRDLMGLQEEVFG